MKFFSKVKSFFKNLGKKLGFTPERKLNKARKKFEKSKAYLKSVEQQVGKKRNYRAFEGYKRRGRKKDKSVKVHVDNTLSPSTTKSRGIKQIDINSARVSQSQFDSAEAVIQFKLNVVSQITAQARVAWADPEYKYKAEQYWNNHPELWDVFDDFDDFYDWCTKLTKSDFEEMNKNSGFMKD